MNKADFNVPDLIIKKRNGESLSSAEMDYFVKEVVNGGVQECQLGKTARKLEKIKESFLIKFDSDASVENFWKRTATSAFFIICWIRDFVAKSDSNNNYSKDRVYTYYVIVNIPVSTQSKEKMQNTMPCNKTE